MVVVLLFEERVQWLLRSQHGLLRFGPTLLAFAALFIIGNNQSI